jgi:non-heme chloroperoxidase
VFDQIRAGIVADRAQYWKGFAEPFYGYNRPGAKTSDGVRESFWLQSQTAGFTGAYLCVKAFSETDFTEDVKKFDVPTLILHGDDDQIVPIEVTAKRSAKMIPGATLKVYKGAPHGMCTTIKDQINADLLEFIRQPASKTRAA